MTKKYLETILPLIKQFDNKEITENLELAYKYWDNEEEFQVDGYEEDPLGFAYDTISDLLYGQNIKVEAYDITLDVGENTTKPKKIKDKFSFPLLDIYEMSDITDDEFFVVENDTFHINPDYDDGHIADEISDETGWLVISFKYKVIME